MFWKEKQNKFSIRKFNRGVASVIIGMTAALFFVPNLAIKAELTALAHTNVAREQISYKYVLYSELTSDEKARIQATIPARQVGDTHTYYMVYRPKTNLPQTGDIPTFTSSLVGLGLLIIGLSLTKDRKKRIVRSLIILTATGSLSVAAISTGSLSGFDKQFTLSIGEALPQAVISIDQHEFVGYILEGHVNSEAITVSEAIIDEQGSSSELILPNILVEGISKHSEAPIVDDIIPEEPTVPVAPSEPVTEQPETPVPPSTESEVLPEEPTDPVVPSAPVTEEPEIPVTPAPPSTEGEVLPEEPTDPVVPSAPVTEEPETPVTPAPPSTEGEVLPEEPTDPVVPSAPVTEQPEAPVPPATEDEVLPEEPTDPVVPSSPVTEQPEEPETPVPPATEDEVQPAEPTDPVGPSSPVTEQPEEPETPVPPSTEDEVQPEEPTAPVAPSEPITEQPEAPVPPATEDEVLPEEPTAPVVPSSPVTDEPEAPVPPSTEDEVLPEEPTAPVVPSSPVTDEPEAPVPPATESEVQPEEPTDPVVPSSPVTEQPEAPVPPATEDEVLPEEPTDSVVPSAPVTEEPETPVTPAPPSTEGEVLPEEPTDPVVPSAPVTEEPETPVTPAPPSTEGEVLPEEPTAPVVPSSPVTDEPEAPVPPSTEDEVLPEEPTAPVVPSAPVTEEPEAPVPPATEDEVQPEEPTAPVVPSTPVTEQPEEPETPVPPSTEVEVLPEEPKAPVVPNNPVTEEPEEPIKTKPKLVLSILKENVDDKSVELSYTLTDSDSTFVKVLVSLYKGDELVTEKEILTKEELYKVQFANLLLNTEYKVKTRFAYNLGSDDVEEELGTEKFELENKLLELREYKSIELYQVDEFGEKTRVTALTSAPISSENYLVKISTVNNKDIYLPVDNFENDVNGIKVSIIHPKLVKFNQNNSSFDEHHTFTVDKLVLQEGAYSKFSELVDAINNNPSGTYYLAADMVVDKGVSTDTYITKEFTGSLKSLGEQKTYSILQLDKPLFSTLKNARVENISLKDVSIKNDQTAVAALARKADTATIDKVSVSGNITAKQNIAGLVYEATNGTSISNSIVNVNLSNTASHETYHIGGVTGILNSSTIDKVRATVAIDAKTASGRGQGIGGIVANAQGAVIKNSYVTGNIHATETADTGGVVGLARMSVLNNIVTGASVTNGGIIASGQNAYATVGSTISNLYSVEGHAAGQPNPTIQSTSLSQEAVLEKIKAWGIPTTPTTTEQENSDSQSNSVHTIDYNLVQNAQAERRTAYENTAKLLPFYDRNTIVKYGNLIDEASNLYSKPIQSVLTLNEDGVATNIYDQHASLTKLLIHYEDGTSEVLPLVYKGEYGNTKVVEYRLGEQLLYTPEQLLSLETSLIDELVTAFSQVDLYSQEMADILHIQTTDKNAKLKDLYLDESFAEVKDNLEVHIKGLLANRQVVDTTSKAVRDVIKKEFLADKEKIMFALAYLNRLYGITYGDTNIKNIVLHHADFYKRQLDTLGWLKSFTDKITKDTDQYYVSQQGYEDMYFDRLTLANNAEIHKERFGAFSSQLGTVRDFLEYNKKLFLGETDSRKWFKEATNAFVYEIPSNANSSIDTSLYSHLGRIPRYEKYYLPLLNIKEKDDIFVMSSMATVAFGGYGRYVDTALKKTNPEQYYQAVKTVQTSLIPKHGKRLGDFLDMWYQMADSHLRDKFIQRSTEIWDGYWIKDSNAFEDQTDKRRWASKYDQEYRYVQELAGALNEWHRKSTDSAFSDTVTFVKFSNRDMLSDLGDSTMSHELIHNYDETIMLDGHKRRPGQDAESYAMGLLQSSAGGGIYYYGFNFMNEHSPNTPHNVSSSRFKTKEDLQTYLKGIFDVTYLLDAVEIHAIAAKGKEAYPYFFNKIELVPVNDANTNQSLIYQNAHDRIRKLRDDELDNLNIATINDAIDHALVAKSSFLLEQDYLRENLKNYYFVPLYYPIYAGLQNNSGTVGGLQFRKTALELLAAKGWEEGFIPYATDKLKAEAEAAGQPLSDQFIFEKIFANQYADYTSFKKAMYKERWDKKDRLKAITISFNGQTKTIDNIETLSRLMAEAVDKDYQAAQNGQIGFNRQGLKDAILKAYVKLTDSFSSSIFGE
ncbi:ZmpA/ZmpB/ZmpC family metallo-endopeptidase [Streptococcus suis]|uniref:ZmpA/ZmpB/ZmpC family metallo-endopeptidase n=1 Tax=Streptococcus suis TaxID=1307 RepID=UPI00211C3F6E|nr:ZmpA/ZmpB/ZmpC family metallo-endopeptidase [Streptococcus suis]MCQ9225117.1 YSIRK-type signal peptide-containing protein [Streptococcus suis]MCQ9227389.1 YSIRK-type signal peptide-containing protein [Streptococcus suis]MCQ9241581.1 YSIRK-type signal peptide-containing protein [Streptococcus suis]MCQ9273684.1 YSIRK-type signal peptide-containing protein [Streptococcus suis]MDE7535745.1 ZmpA/ZmpB/ZmpC family metallo-endopeptidase [Streptococcus suis]